MKKILQLSMLLWATISFGQTPIYEFNFDGNSNNSGAGTFNGFSTSGSGVISYVNNRSGQANKAINIPNTIQYNFSGSANAPSLPVGNSARTLSFWVKFIDDTDNKTYMPVGWGTSSANQAFGFWRNGVQNSYYTWGSGNDYNVPQTNAQIQATNNGWVHIAMTHNGTTLTIYYNGVDAGNYPRTLNTFGPSDLTLNRLVNNSNNATGTAFYLDDLKIYNVALTPAQMQQLYTNNTSTLPVVAPVVAPVVTNLPNVTTTSTTANIAFAVNPGGEAATTEIILSEFGTANEVSYAGPTSSNGTTDQVLSAAISGLMPGTCYNYRIFSTNSVGTNSGDLGAFCSDAANGDGTPIYHFNFNGNLNNSGPGTVTSGFVPNGTVFYEADRFGVANRAFDSSTQVAGAILPNLPIGSSARTLNLWVKFNSNTANFTHYLMSWGTLGGGLESAFALSQSNTTAGFYTDPTGANIPNTINTTSWLMYTYTYDGSVLKHYINGVLKSSVTRNIATLIGSAGKRLSLCRAPDDITFRIGAFNIDEASIYNVALTQAQITSLFTINSLSNNDFLVNNLQFSLFPNPTNDLLNIDFTTEIKNVEIYSLQGQKVLFGSDKQINVSNLASGMYMVRVQDVDGAVATQKFTKQ